MTDTKPTTTPLWSASPATSSASPPVETVCSVPGSTSSDWRDH
jgi:hypothetical protein